MCVRVFAWVQIGLQRLHHKLATQEILNDFRAVTEHLSARGIPAPRLVDPLDAPGGVAVADGRWWRLQTYVEGETHDAVTSAGQAEEGARMLARFCLGRNLAVERLGPWPPPSPTSERVPT